jgi:RNA polymerase sigma-70 factor, ECF subfamily
VITLRDVMGHTSDEVCQMLELSGANQRVLLHRARAAVRTHLASYLEQEFADDTDEVRR